MDEEEFRHIGLAAFFDTEDDVTVDWEECFGLMAVPQGDQMQALRITQNVSQDGFLHIKVPPDFSAKRVELIILAIPEPRIEPSVPSVKEPEAEWDVDYEAADAGFGQTLHTFELLDQECGPEDPSKWK